MTVVIEFVVVGGCWFVFAFFSIEVNPNTSKFFLENIYM